VIGEARKDDGVPKDPLYRFIVEKRPTRSRKPWALMAIMTLVVPAAILLLTHWVVEQDFYQKQGAIVLLFFGWVTGAQLIFSTYRMSSENLGRVFGLVIFSFAIVVLGYTLIGHAFDLFLYPDEEFRAGIYSAAKIDVYWFDILAVVITAIIITGWLRAYYRERTGRHFDRALKPLWLGFYALVSREFYISDLYSWITRQLDLLALRLNAWLRWV
jgi:NADH-quinone oxidoreductase subunit L